MWIATVALALASAASFLIAGILAGSYVALSDGENARWHDAYVAAFGAVLMVLALWVRP